MLLFSTILSIKDIMTKEAFVRLVIEWNQSHSHEANRIPDLVWNGEMNTQFGNENLWMRIEEYRNKNIIAVRYEKAEDNGVIWDTDYVMNFDEMKMSIRLDRSYLEEAVTANQEFSSPQFIQLLIDQGYVEDDGDMPIARHPVFITSENLQLVADVINGMVKYHLPVVYVSRLYSDKDSVDVEDMAKRLKGVAHVLVQENSWSSLKLREKTNSNNEYDGAVGIYFPNRAVGHAKYLHHDYPGSDVKLAERVIKRILEYSTSQRMDVLYTWSGVNNALLRDRYSSKKEELIIAESARKSSEATAQESIHKAAIMEKEAERSEKRARESEDLVDSVDEEIRSMRQQIESLTNQNDALTCENMGLHARLDGLSAQPVIYLGTEEEFFPDEIKEFILGAVQNELKKTEAKTRKADVLGDILRSNGGFQDIALKRSEKLKNILRGYRNLSGTQKRELEALGFMITKDGGHYKLRYNDDGRYMSVLGATPSDHRAGENNAQEIIRKMF